MTTNYILVNDSYNRRDMENNLAYYDSIEIFVQFLHGWSSINVMCRRVSIAGEEVFPPPCSS